MKQRQVHFGDASVRTIPEFTDAERAELWFGKTDLKVFRLLSANYSSNNTNSATNIENKDNDEDYFKAKVSISQRRRTYIQYVLHIQHVNRTSGIVDPIGLRALAVAQSKGALESAKFRALKLGTEVAAYYQEDQEEIYGDYQLTQRLNATSLSLSSSSTTTQPTSSSSFLSVVVEDNQSCDWSRNQNRSPCRRLQRPRRNRTGASMA